MANAKKFTFDTHFGDQEAGAKTDARSRKSYSADEIDAIRKDGHDAGKKDGDIRAAQAVAASIAQVAAAVTSAIGAMDAEIEAIRAEAASLAFAAARKLAGAALSAAPEEEIADALAAALHQAVGEPRLIVKTAPRLAVAMEARAAKMAADQGFEGRIQFVSDAMLGDADCRIEWHGGGIERSHRAIETALAELIGRRFAAAQPSGVEE